MYIVALWVCMLCQLLDQLLNSFRTNSLLAELTPLKIDTFVCLSIRVLLATFYCQDT